MKHTILVVDDSPVMALSIKSVFEGVYQVKVATCGEDALIAARETQPPDIILLDVTMPGMDGYEVCRHLKADPATAEIPVIFLTSHTDPDEEAVGFELGAVDYIHKPALPVVLLARVKTQLALVRAARESKKYQARFNAAADISGMGIWTWDITSNAIEWDARTFAIYGLDPERHAEVPKYDYFCSCVNPKDLPRVEQAIQQALMGEKEFDCQFELTLPNGVVRHVRKQAKVFRDAEGRPISLLGTSFDITETVLRNEQSKLFELVIAKTNDSVVICEAPEASEPRIIYVNQTFESFTGYSPAEVMGKNPRFLQAPGINSEGLNRLRAAIKAGQLFRGELLNIKKGGELFWVSMNLTPLADESGKITHWVSIQRDITARKEAEAQSQAQYLKEIRLKEQANALNKALDLEKARLQLSCRSSQAGIWEWDIVRNKLDWDDQMYVLYQTTRDEFSNAYDAWFSRVHPDDQEMANQITQLALQGEKPYASQFRLRLSDGSIRHIKAEGTVFRDENQNPIRMIGINTDITEQVEKAEALAIRQDRLDMAQKTSGFGIWDLNLTTGDVYWDRNTRLMFGLDPSPHAAEDVIDSWRKIVHPKDLPRLEREIQSAIEGDKPYDTQYRGVLADGQARHFKSSATVIRDEQGRAIRMVGVNFDVTDEVDRAERMKLAELVIDNTNDMVFICEAEPIEQPGPRIVFVNKAFEQITGYSKEEVIGKTPRILQGPDTDRATLDRIRKALANWQPVREEVLNYKKTGEPFWDEINITPVANAKGWFTHWISIQRDITQRKQHEKTLGRALREAQAANQAKSRFLATMSHELRTPMNGIMGMAQLLTMGDTSDVERQDYAQTILTSGKALTKILNDILDLSAIEAEKITLVEAPFELAGLLHETMTLFAPMAREKGLAVESDCHGLHQQIYTGDGLRLRQMLSNYLSNAIKFTETGTVRVAVKELETRPGAVLLGFSVADSGIGIPLDQQAKLFQSFTQIDDSYARKYEGTGLGLSIVKALAELMGGGVDFTSTPEVGSVFSFSVWLKPAADEPLKTLPQLDGSLTSHKGTRKQHALLVDDNPINLKVTAAILAKMNWNTTTCENGLEAVNLIKQGMRPDIVLMDLQMPVLDGIAATELIRAWEAEHNQSGVTIVALTGAAFGEDRDRCMNAGMDDYLTKPINLEKLTGMLNRWASHRVSEPSQSIL